MLLEVSLLATYVLIHICDSFPAAGFQYLRTIKFYMENNYYAVVCMLIHGDWKSTITLRLINWYETRITIKIDRTFCSENKVRNETDYFHLKAEWNRHETIWTTTMEERKFSLSMTLAGFETALYCGCRLMYDRNGSSKRQGSYERQQWKRRKSLSEWIFNETVNLQGFASKVRAIHSHCRRCQNQDHKTILFEVTHRTLCGNIIQAVVGSCCVCAVLFFLWGLLIYVSVKQFHFGERPFST